VVQQDLNQIGSHAVKQASAYDLTMRSGCTRRLAHDRKRRLRSQKVETDLATLHDLSVNIMGKKGYWPDDSATTDFAYKSGSGRDQGRLACG